jgi:DNA-binding Lrp family transcriptional regulator
MRVTPVPPFQENHMPVSAYVLIQTEVGRAATVARTVASLDGVVAAEGVTGPYDVIVRAEAATVDELGRMVVGRIQLIEGITRTVTCPVVNL